MHFGESRETRGKQRIFGGFLRSTLGFIQGGICTLSRVKNEAPTISARP
jgi:hypothetical protein